MPGFGIISNPYAKVNRTDPEHNTLIWYVLGNRGRFEVTSTLEDLGKVCQNFQARGIDHVGIVGGDGTITRTLTALVQSYGATSLPRILVLRGGTINVLASNLGIFGQPKDILSDALDSFHANTPMVERNVRSLMVNGNLGFLVATTGAVRFLEAFYKNKTDALGAGVFFGGLLLDGLSGGLCGGQFQKLAEPETLSLRSQWQDKTTQKTITTPLVMASSLAKLPYGIPFFPDLANRDDCGEVVYAQHSGRRLVTDIAAALLNPRKRHEALPTSCFQALDLRWNGPANYTLDGELLRADDGHVSITLGPIFRFCSPYGKISAT
jgi:diacylglycerol kinase family enzyme